MKIKYLYEYQNNTKVNFISGKKYSKVKNEKCLTGFGPFILYGAMFPYQEARHPDYIVQYFDRKCSDLNSRDCVFIQYSIKNGSSQFKGILKIKVEDYIFNEVLDLELLQTDIMSFINAIQQSRIRPYMFLQFLLNNETKNSLYTEFSN